jgi:ribokinase
MANQSAAAGRLGADVALISMVGELDHYNDVALDDLKWANVNIDNVGTMPGEYTGTGYGLVSESSQNSFIIILGANGGVTPEYVESKRHMFEKADICMAEYMIPMETVDYTLSLAKKLDKVTIINPSPYVEADAGMLKNIDIMTLNEVEAAELCGFEVESEESTLEACQCLHSKGVDNVIITLGSRGAFASDGKEHIMLASYKVDALDTTGAGDVFNGAMAFAYDRGYDLFTAVRFANAASSVSVQRVGTMRSSPSLDEVEKVFKLPVK